MEYKLLFSPMKIGRCEIKNRIVMPPMLMGFADFDGNPTEKLMNYYEERAKGGAGLIMTEITRVNDDNGAAAFAQLSMSHDRHIAGMSEMARRIHRHGAKLFVQLHHPGRQNVGLLVHTVPLSIASENLTGGLYGKLLYKMVPKIGPKMLEKNLVFHSVAPSACEPAYFAGGKVRALSRAEIKKLEQQFIDAAVRCLKAGVDGVELHSTHGYLFQQFLSPVTNHRTDEYGGSLENRMRFLLNVLRGIKAACGDVYPVIVRLTADECYDRIGQPGKGYTLEEGVKIAKALEENGADAIDVSSAGYDTFNYWLEPVSFEPGWRKYMTKAVKDAVSIPVLGANLIRTPEQAERQLEEGIQDFVSLGRPHIADPYFAEKAKNGGTIKRCICCLNCIESMQENAYSGGHGECSVNPRVGREHEPIPKTVSGRKVIVIGAGPAGLSAAETLARRGFSVEVIDKNSEPGGQVILAAAPPLKGKTSWYIEDAVAACKELGVKFTLGEEADAAQIAEQKPYAVVVATGSEPVVPRFAAKSVESGMTVTFADILTGEIEPENEKIVLVGSGMTGLETADYLAQRGNDVTIVEMAPSVAPGTWFQHVDDIMPRLKKNGVSVNISLRLDSINDDSVTVTDVRTGSSAEISCERVVLALGSKPVCAIADELKSLGVKVRTAGDSAKVGRIADATKSGYDAAINL